MRALAVLAGAVLLTCVGPARTAPSAPTSVRASTTVPAPVSYAPPLTPLRVVHPFDPPASRYGAGHLGVDLDTTPAAVVRSAGDGVVTFAGSVAGRGLVVVEHADGVSTEYEPVRVTVRAGTLVRRGRPIGSVHGTHGRCRAGRCLHWGARRGGEYLDPLLLLRPLGPVRLLPWSR